MLGSLPDLSQLQNNNGGVFPLASLYEMIAGAGESSVLGLGEVPALGNRFCLDAKEQLSLDFVVSRETHFRTHILALIEYLASLQAE